MKYCRCVKGALFANVSGTRYPNKPWRHYRRSAGYLYWCSSTVRSFSGFAIVSSLLPSESRKALGYRTEGVIGGTMEKRVLER